MTTALPPANTTPPPRPSASPPRAARSAGRGGEQDDPSAETTAVATCPPAPMLGAWQAALAAQQGGRDQAATAASSALTTPSLSQQALAAGAELHAGAQAAAFAAEPAPPLHIEATFLTGPGQAWQLGAQRGPDAAAWQLNLAASAVPAARAGALASPRSGRSGELGHLAERLGDRLRAQGHDIGHLGWRPMDDQPDGEGPA
jgi:hypothetical protein